jgi:membrane-bound serine protease (ClpP class)
VRRTLLVLALCLVPLAVSASEEGGGIDVIDVSGPLDASALEFIDEAIHGAAEEGQELAVLQIDSPAVLDQAGLDAVIETVRTPPLPLAIWVGPAPAVAGGGAAQIVLTADRWAMTPGSEVGPPVPLIAGESPGCCSHALTDQDSFVDLQPSIRQYLQDLDGQTFTTSEGPVTVETLTPVGEGVTLKPVTFRQPGLATRFWRLAVTPEAAFFFLVMGLTIATFEFFAIGPGVAAGVAAISLLLAGWGIVNLPVRYWALGLAVLGWALLAGAYQKGGVLFLTLVGAALLQTAGMFFVDGSGQIDPRWYLVLPSVLVVLFFFLLAMPTVQRARFSTQTIGREGLIGERGVALADFEPDGLVEVKGARWRATAHREAGLRVGSDVVVSGVDGMFLEVEPAHTEREN